MDMNKDFLHALKNFTYLKEVLLTLGLIILFIYLRKILFSQIQKNDKINASGKITQKKRVKNYSNIIFLLVLFLLWGSQIQSIMVSLFAVFAAFVIATKELIMCITGGILIFINNSFKEGDRIEVDDKRGYVIERKLTLTKLLEIGPEKNSQQTTGSIVSIPNSTFLTKSLKNESYFKGYSINSFIFKLTNNINFEDLEDHLIESANSICSPYLKKAASNINTFCEKEGLDIPSIDPRVKVLLDDKNDISLQLKMPVKNTEIAKIEQDLLRSFIQFQKNAVSKSN